jgi:hypothetical protein
MAFPIMAIAPSPDPYNVRVDRLHPPPQRNFSCGVKAWTSAQMQRQNWILAISIGRDRPG